MPSKGSTGRYAARMVIDLIEECGDKDRAIIVKSDQEPAIQFLVDDVCMFRTGANMIVEQAPKGSKGSNGIVERAVQSTEQYLRTLKSALDERISFRIDAKHPILTWLCEYAGFLMNRLEVSVDGKTAYERCKGKRLKSWVWNLQRKKVLWKLPTGAKMEKINARWGYGLFIGVRAKSNELIIVDQEKKDIKYVRTVRRVPLEQRWSADNLEWVRGVPWNRGKEDDDADGDVPVFDVTHGPGRRLTQGETEEMATQETPSIVHRAHLTKKDFDKFGFTDRCRRFGDHSRFSCSAACRALPKKVGETLGDRLEGEKRKSQIKREKSQSQRGTRSGHGPQEKKAG